MSAISNQWYPFFLVDKHLEVLKRNGQVVSCYKIISLRVGKKIHFYVCFSVLASRKKQMCDKIFLSEKQLLFWVTVGEKNASSRWNKSWNFLWDTSNFEHCWNAILIFNHYHTTTFFPRVENCLFCHHQQLFLRICVRGDRDDSSMVFDFSQEKVFRWQFCLLWLAKGLSSILYDFLHFKEANPANAQTPNLQTAKISAVHYPKVLLSKQFHVLLQVRMLLHVHDVIRLLNQISHSYLSICLLFSNTNYYAIAWNHAKFLSLLYFQ